MIRNVGNIRRTIMKIKQKKKKAITLRNTLISKTESYYR